MAGPPSEHVFRNGRGTILVRERDPDGRPMLVTWLPDGRDDQNYPGFSLSEYQASFPTDEPLAAAKWVDAQEWAWDRAPAPANAAALGDGGTV